MRFCLAVLAALIPATAWAEAFQRPIPQPQTAQVEVSYLAAAVIMVAALIALQWLVGRS
jgi:hypothetical protein